MLPLICNFSGAYYDQNFCSGANAGYFRFLDCSQIHGTDCYLDSDAETKVCDLLKKEELQNLHFIDSGNYHYLTKLWTDQIRQKFNLVVFDHHSDMQPPAFDGFLSCGGWIKATLDENPFLNTVYLFGVRDDHVEKIEDKYQARIQVYSESECSAANFTDKLNNLFSNNVAFEFPIYISVDKDVLLETEAKTNWDAGSLPLRTIIHICEEFTKKTSILGMDVCGESAGYDNSHSNKELSELFNRIKIKI